MAYNHNNPQSPPGWGGQLPASPPFSPNTYPGVQTYPTPAVDATALNAQLQPVYQSPQFAPPPVPPKQAGGVLKSLNFFSSKPSFQQTINTGESSLSGPVSPQSNAPFYPAQQQYGHATSPPLAPVYNNTTPTMAPVYNPMPVTAPATPAYNPAAGTFPQQSPQNQGQKPGYQPSPTAGPAQAQNLPPPAYSPNPSQTWQEKPPLQQNAPPVNTYNPGATNNPSTAQSPNSVHNPNHVHNQNPVHNPNHAHNPNSVHNPGPAHNPSVSPNTKPGNVYPQHNAADDTKYWASLVQEGKIPRAPMPELRSLFRGVARCINKECTVDKSPQCVLSAAKMSMYYGITPGYDSRESQLFSRAQTAPGTVAKLYDRLMVEHLLIPSNPGDGRRKPHSPALTIAGFEHWLLINTLINPDAEYSRISQFITTPGRQIFDDAGRPFPRNGFPREALPMGPDAWVVKRYSGFIEEALASTEKAAKEEELSEEEGFRKEIEALKSQLFANKGEMEKKNDELQAANSQIQNSNNELQKKNSELEGAKKQLAESIAKADEAVTKLASFIGVQKHQQQPPIQSPYPPQYPQYPPQTPQGYPPQTPQGYPPQTPQQNQPDQIWPQKPQQQSQRPSSVAPGHDPVRKTASWDALRQQSPYQAYPPSPQKQQQQWQPPQPQQQSQRPSSVAPDYDPVRKMASWDALRQQSPYQAYPPSPQEQQQPPQPQQQQPPQQNSEQGRRTSTYIRQQYQPVR